MALTEETKAEAENHPQKRTRTVFAVRLCIWGREWEIVMTTSDGAPLQNALLPQAKARWRTFSAGALLQVILLSVAFSVPLLFPDRVKDLRRYAAMVIAPAPDVVRAWQPRTPRPHKIQSLEAEHNPNLPLTSPVISPPVVSAPVLKPAKPMTEADAPNIPTDPTPAAVLNEATIPNLQKPRPGVEEGKFGDPNGLSDNAKATRAPNVAQLGSFNGSSGSPGLSGGMTRPVASRGYGVVKEGLFADERAPRTAAKSTRDAEASSLAKPAEILFEPAPGYTSLAQSKKIEGDVLLEVRFSASGRTTVLKIVRGLGYGLDESAEAAAEQIQFRPARDDQGLPVDSTAIVRIVFELAY